MLTITLLAIAFISVFARIPEDVREKRKREKDGKPMHKNSMPSNCDSELMCNSRPNIILITSDDTGYGDLGLYGGGVGRGMATPNFDQFGKEGMQFWSFYAQPSCTPGRAAIQTGRWPNRSGMTTVAFQGQGGGLPKAEWTIASLLKTAGYSTYYSGKWHLGEDEFAMPINHGYDIMDNVLLYHLNAYTYSWSSWNPDMSTDITNWFKNTTKGIMQGKSGGRAIEFAKVTERNISELDTVMVDDAIIEMNKLAKKYQECGRPFFMCLNFDKNHQPNLPAQGYFGKNPINFTYKSAAKSKYADAVVELDHNFGRLMDNIRSIGIADNTFVMWTVDNGTWQDVHPDSGYTPFRGTKGTDREGGVRVPTIAWWPGKIRADAHNHDIVGGIDLMATFASWAGVALPTKDRDGEPIIFDTIDMSPVLFEKGEPLRNKWFYFTENELNPGAVRMGKFKAVFNLIGDNGGTAGNDAEGFELGWRGEEKYVDAVPRIYDLWQDPQERYDLFMNSFTEKTWTAIFVNKLIADLMTTYLIYPPRPLQSQTYPGPLTIRRYNGIRHILEFINYTNPNLPEF